METNEKLYLIDASGFIFRAFHALPPLTNPQKVPVGAVAWPKSLRPQQRMVASLRTPHAWPLQVLNTANLSPAGGGIGPL